MTEPICVDPASDVINTVIAAMKSMFDPTSACPPDGGGSVTVRFLAGEGVPLDEVNCDNPFLWVRLAARYRSQSFPEPSIIMSPCGGMEVITVEIGVARCAIMDETATAEQYAHEAEASLDDSWRIGKTMCLVTGMLQTGNQVGSDMVIPYGPEGGIIAWSSNLHISL